MDDVLIHSSIFDHLWGYKKLPCSPDVSPPRSGIPQGQSLWVAAGTSELSHHHFRHMYVERELIDVYI